jgi:REP element-mobilizing transposase RayT
MSVRRQIQDYSGIFFITFTCSRWLNLIELVTGYDIIYKWFDHLKMKGHYICGYVIMPNHVHVLIGFRHTGGELINTIVGNGKRFIAYEIVKRLKQSSKQNILDQLASNVNEIDRRRKKLHEVFEPSFDWKPCTGTKFIEQKLNYMHSNPCKGKWNLADNPCDYAHCSARYYSSGEHAAYPVTSYAELEDIDLSVRVLDDMVRAAESRNGDSAEK